jgi:hypothetical protein
MCCKILCIQIKEPGHLIKNSLIKIELFQSNKYKGYLTLVNYLKTKAETLTHTKTN